MVIHCYKTKKEAGEAAAASVANIVKSKPDAVLGLATGSSPIETYRALIDMNKKGEVSFSRVKTVNLDEYRGISSDNPQSYAKFMRENLFDHIDVDINNTNIPNGLAEDSAAECARYDLLINSIGGIDVQLLGIGHNGHIGFNEPSDAFACGTALVSLSKTTVQANARFFDSPDEVPTQAFSMGIDQIMKAGKIILLANGKDKAEIIDRALFGKVTPDVPASVLQLARDVEVYLDEDAASVISKR